MNFLPATVNGTQIGLPFGSVEIPEDRAERGREKDLDGEGLRTQLVVSLEGASTDKEGDEAEIFVNTKKIHLFDPESGGNLTRGL